MKLPLFIGMCSLALACPLTAQQPFGRKPSNQSNAGDAFDKRLHSRYHDSDPTPVVMVLLRDGRYIEFAPADVLTLQQLVEKLPPGAINDNCRLLLFRRNEGVLFSTEGIKPEYLSKFSLARWDVIKIEEVAKKE